MITAGQAVISVFFLMMAFFSLESELDFPFFLFSTLCTCSSAAFIIYTSANPVPGSEDSTLSYFYVLLSINCVTVVAAFIRRRLANNRKHATTDITANKNRSNTEMAISNSHAHEEGSEKNDRILIKKRNKTKKKKDIKGDFKKNQ